MKEQNTHLLGDVAGMSRDGDRDLGPPPRAGGALPSNTFGPAAHLAVLLAL